IACPQCKSVLAIPPGYDKVRCQKCGSVLRIAAGLAKQEAAPRVAKTFWRWIAFAACLVVCLALIGYAAYQLHVMATETETFEKAKADIAEKQAFNDDLLRRATAAQADADRKLVDAKAKADVAEEAPRQAALLVKRAEEERKEADAKYADAQKVLSKNLET